MTILLLDFILAAIVFILYYPSIKGPFLFDDLILWVVSPELRDYLSGRARSPFYYLWRDLKTRHFTLENWVGYWHTRPLTWFTYHVDAGYGGFDTRGWHYTSMVLHVASSISVLELIRHWEPLPYAFLGALIFTVHPLSTSAVAYISGRSSLLCGLFMIVSCALLVERNYLLAVLAGVAAFLSKPEAVILIFLAGGALWLR